MQKLYFSFMSHSESFWVYGHLWWKEYEGERGVHSIFRPVGTPDPMIWRKNTEMNKNKMNPSVLGKTEKQQGEQGKKCNTIQLQIVQSASSMKIMPYWGIENYYRL